jgi:ligand-binding sensor domain-containing protein
VGSLTRPPEFTLDQWTTVDGLPQYSVNAIALTPDGYIWVGTFGGLARFDCLRFSVVERVDDAGRHVDRVLSLAVAPDSSVWVGTENGLLRYRGGRFSYFTTADGLPDNQILALHFDRAATLWIDTQHGGARYENGRFDAFREADGSALDQVVSFAEDRAGVLSLNTWEGFLTFEKERFTGYNVRWGIAPTKLYQTYQRFADQRTTLQLRALTVGQPCCVAIESFDENGVSTLSTPVALPPAAQR